jgi:cytochrome c oxidase assembly factor CtaG
MPRLIGRFGAVLVSAMMTAAAAAHDVQLEGSPGWGIEPWTLGLIALAAAGYVLGVRRLGRRRLRRVLGPSRRIAFALGLVALGIALVSPLDALAERMFAAHMLQHLILMLVVPPLLVWARPGIALLWAFPLGARRAIGQAWTQAPGVSGGFAQLMHPLVVYILASVAFWFWHLPGPYDAALSSELIHVAEHVCLLVTSLAFWTIVLEPYGTRRLGYAATFAFVATFALQNGLLGALLTFAARPLYYAHASLVIGLTALEDQQLAGLLMWIPASAIQLAALLALCIAGMRHAEARAIDAGRLRSMTPLGTFAERQGSRDRVGAGNDEVIRQDSGAAFAATSEQRQRSSHCGQEQTGDPAKIEPSL